MSQSRSSGGQRSEPGGSMQENRATSEPSGEYGVGGTAMAPAVGHTSKAREYGQGITDVAAAAKEYVSDKAAAISSTLHELSLAEQAKTYTRKNPTSGLLLSGAVGLFLGLLLPSRRRSYTEAPLPGEEILSIPEAPSIQALSIEEDLSYAPAIVTPQAQSMPTREYIVSIPTRRSSGRLDAQLNSLNTIPDLRILDESEADNKLLLLTDAELADIRTRVPGLVIEPNIFYKFGTHVLMEKFNKLHPPPKNRTIKVRVVDTENNPLSGVTVYLVTSTLQDRYTGYRGTTAKNGVCRIPVARSSSTFESLIVDPEAGYWTRRIPKLTVNDELTVELNPLPCNKSALYDWGHQFAGMNDDLPQGKGVTIGIIDSGASNHPGLRFAKGVNCVREKNSPWYEDESGHGTHCAGVLAATISGGRGVKGYVPRARIIVYKTVPKNAPGPIADAVLRAIKAAVKDRCDIISMSFGTSECNVHSALWDNLSVAYENGIFCVAAAGNEARDVHYPAAFPFVMGVGAFGKLQTYPADSLHAEFESPRRSPRNSKYYLAKFSNSGRNIDFCAPGVAVVSTVPGGGYVAKDGTSMACPQVAGIAALALAAHPEIMRAERNEARVDDLIRILKTRSEPLGFGPRYEGAGGLKISPLLGA